MQVTSATNYAALLTQQKMPSTSFTPVTNTNPASSSASTNSVGTFDFTDMTPNQMKSTAQSLSASGKIDSKQAMRLQLMGMPLGKMVDGKFQPLTSAERDSYANTPVNYMQLIQSNMTFLQQNGMAGDPKSGYADDQTILSAMRGAQGSVSSVNITA